MVEDVIEEIWLDWLYERDSKLGNARFNDPKKYFHPFYAMGDLNSTVIVVAMATAYNVEGWEETNSVRSQIVGYQDMSDKWSDDIHKHREKWLKKRQNSDTNKLYEWLEALTSEVDLSPQDLYFTNLQKDGEFGNDLSVLNDESKEVWKEYLSREIEFVDPDLIVTLGKSVAVELVGTGGVDQHGEMHDLDGRPLLTLNHWGYYLRGGGPTREGKDEYASAFSEAYSAISLDN